jgi:hypothetical protein
MPQYAISLKGWNHFVSIEMGYGAGQLGLKSQQV